MIHQENDLISMHEHQSLWLPRWSTSVLLSHISHHPLLVHGRKQKKGKLMVEKNSFYLLLSTHTNRKISQWKLGGGLNSVSVYLALSYLLEILCFSLNLIYGSLILSFLLLADQLWCACLSFSNSTILLSLNIFSLQI